MKLSEPMRLRAWRLRIPSVRWSLAVLVASAPLAAQTPPQSQKATPAPILGVFDAISGAPLEGASVIDLYVDDVYRTGPSGLVGLWAFTKRNDSVAVRVRKIGYADTAFIVMARARDTAPISVFLNRAAILATVLTEEEANRHLTPNMREFESRARDPSLHGRFMTTEELVRIPGKPIGDILHDLTSGKSRGCSTPIRLFIDGIPSGDNPDTLSRTGKDYEGIEFYTPGAAPLRFNMTAAATGQSVATGPAPPTAGQGPAGGAVSRAAAGSSIRAASSCGVAVLWRRERVFP